MRKTCLFCDLPVAKGNGWQSLTCSECERIHMDRIKMSTVWCKANPWPVDPLKCFGPQKFAEVAEENLQIARARWEAGPNFCKSNPWPAVPDQELEGLPVPVASAAHWTGQILLDLGRNQAPETPAERLPAIPNHSWSFNPEDLFITRQSIKTTRI